MSLGGYKFAGRYCQKGSLTDVQWALQMHKTKVAAFMAANAVANAEWRRREGLIYSYCHCV